MQDKELFSQRLGFTGKLEEERKRICLAIGQRIRKSRKEKKLTLGVMADRTGFSQGYLSQIENLKREPSIGTLTKIAHALSVDTLYLLSGLQPEIEESDFTIVRADERKLMPDAFGLKGFKYHSLVYKKKDRLMDAYVLEMGFDFPKLKPWHGQELVFVLEGSHECIYDGVSYILNEGDAYYFDASKPHIAKSIGSKPSRVLVVFTSGKEKR